MALNAFQGRKTKACLLCFFFRKLDIALRALGFNPPDDEMQELKVLLEVDGDTTLDFSEFCMVVEHLKDVKGKQGELRFILLMKAASLYKN